MTLGKIHLLICLTVRWKIWRYCRQAGSATAANWVTWNAIVTVSMNAIASGRVCRPELAMAAAWADFRSKLLNLCLLGTGIYQLKLYFSRKYFNHTNLLLFLWNVFNTLYIKNVYYFITYLLIYIYVLFMLRFQTNSRSR